MGGAPQAAQRAGKGTRFGSVVRPGRARPGAAVRSESLRGLFLRLRPRRLYGGTGCVERRRVAQQSADLFVACLRGALKQRLAVAILGCRQGSVRNARHLLAGSTPVVHAHSTIALRHTPAAAARSRHFLSTRRSPAQWPWQCCTCWARRRLPRVLARTQLGLRKRPETAPFRPTASSRVSVALALFRALRCGKGTYGAVRTWLLQSASAPRSISSFKIAACPLPAAVSIKPLLCRSGRSDAPVSAASTSAAQEGAHKIKCAGAGIERRARRLHVAALHRSVQLTAELHMSLP